MRQGLVTLVVVLAAVAAAPVQAAPTAYDQAFVDAFAAACVPGRLSYGTSLGAAVSAGWVPVDPEAHAELAAVMDLAVEEALAAEEDLDELSFFFEAFAKQIEGVTHHLVISRSSAVIGDRHEPINPWVFVGCHLYNFDATAPLDPQPVTALIGNAISRTEQSEGQISHVWGPPCPMPRTGDSYLSFVAEGSPAATIVPFTGVALNFSTSELDVGEPVPDPYC